MKIGIFTPYLNSLSGGEKYILTAAECLSSKHEVFIFWDPRFESEIKKKAFEKLGINLSAVRFANNIFDRGVSLLFRLFSSRAYDYIIFLSDGSIPFVLSNLIIHFQFPVEWVNAKSFKTKIKFLNIKNVICNSSFTKSYIDKKFGIKSAILYPPTFIGKAKTKQKEKVILHVGRFETNIEGTNFKKQDVMIDVFKEMVRRGLKDWRFVLVVSFKKEDGGNLSKLKKKAQGLPIEFIENPNNSALQIEYGRAQIYWHATGFGEDLIRHPERAEHFGIATVEAMDAGAVPVVINAGGQREIVEDGKNGFLWNTPEELQEKTLQIIHNEDLWQKLSKASKERAKFFSERRFCEELEKIIK